MKLHANAPLRPKGRVIIATRLAYAEVLPGEMTATVRPDGEEPLLRL